MFSPCLAQGEGLSKKKKKGIFSSFVEAGVF